MSSIDEYTLENEFHFGKTIHLDDFPYVLFMRQIDNELAKLNQNRLYYPDDESSFYDSRSWGFYLNCI